MMMKLDRDKLQEDIHRLYREEHEALGEEGTARLLANGRHIRGLARQLN